jgi:hypothetical protein
VVVLNEIIIDPELGEQVLAVCLLEEATFVAMHRGLD